MKKSLIAVAVASAFIAPAAMAEVTLSGAINLGIELSKSSGATNGTSSLTKTSIQSNYSHVDLESVDDIGGGNKVIFHYQLVAAPQSTGVDNTNRNSFLGIAGSWGAFKMGTNENVYERFMYTADPLDGALGPGGNLMILGTPGANAAFQAGQGSCGPGGAGTFSVNPSTGAIAQGANSSGGCVDFYRRTDHTIWYESPNWSGFSFEVDYTLSAFKSRDTGGNTTDPKVLSIGGKFQPDGAPFYVDLAYEKHDDMFGANALGAVGGSSSSDTGVQLGVGYNIGDLGLHARYERLKYETDGTAAASPFNEYKRNAYWFGVKYNLPSGYVGAELGIAQKGKTNVGTADDTGAKMFGIGYFHNLSKQSQLQFIYGLTDNDDNATYTQSAAPLKDAGSKHQVLHVGLKHTF